MKKEALLLIDIQDIYFSPGPLMLYKAAETAKKAAILLEQFRNEEKAVIHIQHNFKLMAGINRRVKPIAGEKVIRKDYPNAFLHTDLQDYLEKNEITKIVIAGMMSHMCVDTTTRACQDYGYEITVIEDACTTRNLKYKGKTIPAQTVHEVFMASLDKEFAEVMALEEYYENKR